MQMISFYFFALVSLTYLCLYVCNKAVKDTEKCIKISNLILLVSSYVFIIYADYRFALVLAALTVSTYFFAKSKKYNFVGVIVSVAALAFFKYTNFFISSFMSLFGQDFTLLNIILPLGISFYSFSAISYLADVKRGKEEPQSLFDVALYLAFFPKLTSGPISKGGDFFIQSHKKRNIGFASFSEGIQIFAIGLFKKIVLADRLSVFVGQVFDTPNAFGSLTVFAAAVAYSLQIYFDFSGYSDMAIGTAKLLGFDLPRNFNIPYLSHNVTEFWKRWHITLSSWLQEYLYISLGGNRKGKIRTYVNLVLTMLIGGIWHGASLTYIVWGALHGLALVVHKIWMKLTHSAEKKHSGAANFISVILTFLFTTFSWIFFRAETMGQAFSVTARIFSFKAGLEQPYMWLIISALILAVCSAAAIIKSRKKGIVPKKTNVSIADGYYPLLDLTKLRDLTLFFIFLGIIVSFAYTGGSPFIYGKY